MSSPSAIYAAENCKAAFQLNWSLTVFWRSRPQKKDWLEPLQSATEADGIRILQHRFASRNESLFFISTKPDVPPVEIPRRIKGRLQHLIRNDGPKPFQRNYALRSIGATTRESLDLYLASQLGHHPMADARVNDMLGRYQIHQPEVDLSVRRQTAHAVFWYNLHIVIVNAGRWREVREEVIRGHHDMILRASRAKKHLLSRAAIVADHVHLTLGCDLQESPEDVALGYMNNLSLGCGMKPLFTFGYYAGTFGEYDRGAIRDA